MNNDGLLANHLATQERLSYEEAVTRIQAMVADWNNTLTSFDSLNLESIGIFSYNEEKACNLILFRIKITWLLLLVYLL
ncbi:hypothetical protein QNH98_09445 [Myroides sp. mNGS23_01]|nr:hypothetical protein [Myroides sp. mNGS23_01]WHT40726.1 hypothetical protein QNH98_09445 [Myroides sp. mNGS23_01]